MKKLCLLSILLIFSYKSFTQTTAALQLQSYAYKLDVTKDENFFVCTRAGEVIKSGSINDYWNKINPVKNSTEYSLSGELFDNVNFFNADTGFVSGFINNENKYNIIYKTTDGGKSWNKINFGQDGWVDDAVSLDNGEAWLSVAGSGIAYTSDFGNTWKAFGIPEKKQRFASIYFNINHEGIIGSLWNMIAITKDNCKNWSLLPTPLDQAKYTKTNLDSRPEINKVALFKNYIFCCQENLVFYTKRDSINWILLKDYSNFYTDAENSALYALDNKSHFIKLDDKLKPVFTSPEINARTSAECKNGSLFIFSGDKIIELENGISFISNPILTNQASEIKPVPFGYSEAGYYGSLDNKIFIQRNFNGEWNWVETLPFKVDSGNLSLLNEETIVYARNDDSIFYYNLSNKKVIAYSKDVMIKNFCDKNIKQIIFQKGSSGCFHNYSDNLTYTLNDGSYEMEEPVSSGSKHSQDLPDNDESIDPKLVENFIKNLPLIINRDSKIEDLGFTEKDYSKCRKDILEFQNSVQNKKKNDKLAFQFNQNNLDFTRLISLVDSIKNIDSSKLTYALLNLNEIWSTTTNWTSIKFINSDNQILVISSNYYEPNAFYFPWVIRLNGLNVVSLNNSITNFVREVYPALLSNQDRVEVLHTLVKKLY